MPPWAVGVLAVLGFIAVWVLQCWAVAHVSGWARLAGHYRAATPFPGPVHRFNSFWAGWVRWNHTLTAGAGPHGLYLAVHFPFRPGHPPLFVPWADVTATPGKGWLTEYLDLRFAQAPRVVVRLSAALGRQLAADANRAWADGPA